MTKKGTPFLIIFLLTCRVWWGWCMPKRWFLFRRWCLCLPRWMVWGHLQYSRSRYEATRFTFIPFLNYSRLNSKLKVYLKKLKSPILSTYFKNLNQYQNKVWACLILLLGHMSIENNIRNVSTFPVVLNKDVLYIVFVYTIKPLLYEVFAICRRL